MRKRTMDGEWGGCAANERMRDADRLAKMRGRC